MSRTCVFAKRERPRVYRYSTMPSATARLYRNLCIDACIFRAWISSSETTNLDASLSDGLASLLRPSSSVSVRSTSSYFYFSQRFPPGSAEGPGRATRSASSAVRTLPQEDTLRLTGVRTHTSAAPPRATPPRATRPIQSLTRSMSVSLTVSSSAAVVRYIAISLWILPIPKSLPAWSGYVTLLPATSTIRS